jgi:hypothetical protein
MFNVFEVGIFREACAHALDLGQIVFVALPCLMSGTKFDR